MAEDKTESVVDEKEITPRIINTLVEEGIPFHVTLLRKNIWNRIRLLRFGLKAFMRSEVAFTIHPISLGTLLKISKSLIAVEMVGVDGKEASLFDITAHSVMANKDHMVKIIAYALVNARRDPPNGLIRFLDDNLSAKELLQVLTQVVRQMDVTDFLACIVSMKQNLQIVGANRKKQEETSGELSEAT